MADQIQLQELHAKLDDVLIAIIHQTNDNVSGCLVRTTLYERVKQLNMLSVSSLPQVDMALADDGDDS